MFKNYLIVAIRNLSRHKAYTFINVAGLAIGLACSTLILLYIQHEFSYDRHHSKADRIHRLIRGQHEMSGNIKYQLNTRGPVAPALMEECPEIEHTTRFVYHWGVSVSVDNKVPVPVERLYAIDDNFFQVFDFPLIEGNSQTGLQTPLSIFVTQRVAKTLFGKENPMGKTVTINSKWLNNTYTITGILQDTPQTSNLELQIDMLTMTRSNENFWENWTSFPNVRTYILLKPGASASALQAKLPEFMARRLGKEKAQTERHELIPLTQLHLHAGSRYDIAERFFNGNIHTCYTLGIVGIIVVIVACINFLNLSTARSARRMREVGMRKVVGAKRTQIISQFMGESVLLSLFALVFALGVTELTLPTFNTYVQRDLSLQLFHLPTLLVVALIVGILSGSYPAFFLSAFRPASTLKVLPNTRGSQAVVRQGLVVLQFAVSIALIVITLIVFQQTRYMRTADTGINHNGLVSALLFEGAETLKNQFLQHPDISHTTITSMPLFIMPDNHLQFISSDNQPEPLPIYLANASYGALETYQIPLLSGRDFVPQDIRPATWTKPGPAPHLRALLNETAAVQLKVQPGNYLKMKGSNTPLEVVGIFKDYHNRSLHDAIRPMVLTSRISNQSFITMRINPSNLTNIMMHLETVWQESQPNRSLPDWIFMDSFIDENFYHHEKRLSAVFSSSTGLALAIACLGLLGLIAYTAETRTKEIGIRKVLGATEVSIVNLLTKEFLLLVGLASLLAWPVAYYTMGGWLDNFAYRIDLSPTYFIVSTGVALIITLITIAYQALKAARANPVEALKYE